MYLVRTLVDVGDTRIPKLKLTHYQDALLQDAIGQEVTLVIGQQKFLYGMRLPSGPVKPHLFAVIFNALYKIVVLLIGGIFMAVVFAGMGSLGINVLSGIGWIDHPPDISSAGPIWRPISSYARYWPFAIVYGGSIGFLLYCCVIMPLRIIYDVIGCFIGSLYLA